MRRRNKFMAISMNMFSKMMFGMGLANAVLMALVDNKVTPQEIIGILQFTISGTGVNFKITPEDFKVETNDGGGVSLTFSKKLVDKLNFSV
jgi:hypothetical protein